MASLATTPARTAPRAPEPAPRAAVRRRAADALPGVLLGALAVAAFGVALALPTPPGYDAAYALVWGGELLHGQLPSFAAYRAPTEHPLAVAAGTVLALAGPGAGRLLVLLTVAALLVLVAGMHRLGRAALGPSTGLAAAAILCTRPDVAFLAARAYLDVPFLALVAWAGALETERPRRGTPVSALLAVAGLLRPEAWLLSAAYVVRMLPGTSARTWARTVGVALLGPVAWAATDLAVTGSPVFSLTHTAGLARELGRSAGLAAAPGAAARAFASLDSAPVLVLAGLGALALPVLPRARVRVSLAGLALGAAAFAITTGAGLAATPRYLLAPALVPMLLAAIALTGWTALPRGSRARTGWATGAAVLATAAAGLAAARTAPSSAVAELRLRGSTQAALDALLRDPRVAAARRCGPVSVPNHRLIAAVRLRLGAGADAVLARSDPRAAAVVRRGGVAVYAASAATLVREGFAPDAPAVAVPLPGYRFAVRTAHYAAWVRC